MSTDMRPSDRVCKYCAKPLTMGQARYCSRSCSATSTMAGKRGPEGRNWRGGRHIQTNGYVRVWDPVIRVLYEHRVVAERTLGRPLERGEQVHHLNGDKADNRPENLVVLRIREHAILHEGNHFKQTNRWSLKHDACIDCGRTSVRHSSHGRCRSCAWVWGVAHPGGAGRIDSGANR